MGENLALNRTVLTHSLKSCWDTLTAKSLNCYFIMLGCYTLSVCEVISDAELLSNPVVCSLIRGSVDSDTGGLFQQDKQHSYYFSLEERTLMKLCNE